MTPEEQRARRDLDLAEILELLAANLRAERVEANWRHALQESEARIIEAVLFAAEISRHDDELLAGLSRRTERITKKLEALNGATPPAPTPKPAP